MKVYPVNLKIENRRCIVVGGGKVAERKVVSLLIAGAKVTVISPLLTEKLQDLLADGEIFWQARDYHAGDAEGCFLLVCTADSRSVNHQAATEGRAAGALVNVADDPEECDFVIPAKIARGDLLLTISTGGHSPAFSRCLRKELEAGYGEEYGVFLKMLSAQRDEIKEKIPKTKDRERFWREALTSEVMNLLKKGQLKEAEAMIKDAISSIGAQS